MKSFFWLRMLALVKRAVKAMESIAESQRVIADVMRAPTLSRRPPKMSEIFTPSVETRNVEYHRDRDMQTYGQEPLDYE